MVLLFFAMMRDIWLERNGKIFAGGEFGDDMWDLIRFNSSLWASC